MSFQSTPYAMTVQNLIDKLSEMYPDRDEVIIAHWWDKGCFDHYETLNNSAVFDDAWLNSAREYDGEWDASYVSDSIATVVTTTLEEMEKDN